MLHYLKVHDQSSVLKGQQEQSTRQAAGAGQLPQTAGGFERGEGV